MPVGCTPLSRQRELKESNVSRYLEGIGLLSPGERARLEAAGDGNINWVRRACAADGRSWILKQARPALERFPDYAASPERLVFEARYYEIVHPFDTDGVCPRILHMDPEQKVMVLEDLGDAERLDAAFARGADVTSALETLAAFLGRVHRETRDLDLAPRFANDEMRRLHGDHIFLLPYRENEFPLSEAVAAAARDVWTDTELVARIDAAYERYLTPTGPLVHADVQAGNVLLPQGRPVLLDAEIAHAGDAAFDPGTLMAHVWLGAAGRGAIDAGDATASRVWRAYAEAHGAANLPTFADAARYAGIELLRRSLGAARVAAIEQDTAALAAIELGRRLALDPPQSPDAL